MGGKRDNYPELGWSSRKSTIPRRRWYPRCVGWRAGCEGSKITTRGLQNNGQRLAFIKKAWSWYKHWQVKAKAPWCNYSRGHAPSRDARIVDVVHTHTLRRGAQHVSIALYLARRGRVSHARLQALNLWGMRKSVRRRIEPWSRRRGRRFLSTMVPPAAGEGRSLSFTLSMQR